MPCQDATSALPAGTVANCDEAADLHGYQSLLECLRDVPEPRRKCGIRHRLPVVLAFAVAAVLTGADSVTAIGAADSWRPRVPRPATVRVHRNRGPCPG